MGNPSKNTSMATIEKHELRDALEHALKGESVPFTPEQLERMVEAYFPPPMPEKPATPEKPTAKSIVEALPDCRFKKRLESGRAFIVDTQSSVLGMVHALKKAPANSPLERKYWNGAELALKGFGWNGSTRGAQYNGWSDAKEMLEIAGK